MAAVNVVELSSLPKDELADIWDDVSGTMVFESGYELMIARLLELRLSSRALPELKRDI